MVRDYRQMETAHYELIPINQPFIHKMLYNKTSEEVL